MSNPNDRIFPIRSVLEAGSYVQAASADDGCTVDEKELLVWSNGRFVNCDEEPIHIPGSIQSYGALVAIDDASWVVRQVSENSSLVVGIPPSELLKGQSLRDFLTKDSIDILHDHIDAASYFPEDSGPDIFEISFLDEQNSVPLYCALHRYEENGNLVILEFARQDIKSERPEYVPSDKDLEQNLNAKELRRHNELTAALEKFTAANMFDSLMGSYKILDKMESYLNTKRDLKSLSDEVARLVRQIIVFDRVVVYQFDEEWNGECIAESLNPVKKDLQPFYGLHFPASDIPPQARSLYLRNKIRYLYSRQQVTSRLLCRSPGDLKQPLDLSFSILRSMSPIHLKYLGNMSVESSLSISIIVGGNLWGLICCHNNSPIKVSFFAQKFCAMLSKFVSKLVEGLGYQKRIYNRTIITEKATDSISVGKNVNGYIVAKSEDLLSLFNADYAVISIDTEAKVMGDCADSNALVAFVDFLRLKELKQITSSDCISNYFPEFPYQSSGIAGFMCIPLSKSGMDFICFIRREQVKNVYWGGDPNKSNDPKDQLVPRASFSKWIQVVKKRSTVWTRDDLEVAAIVQLVYWRYIDIWRQRDAAVKSNKLKNLLLANVSHEGKDTVNDLIVRTPLNAIINYLEIALETDLNGSARDAVSIALGSSKSLIFIINDLLDLTRIEAGKMLFREEPFNMIQTIREAVEMFRADAARKNIDFSLRISNDIPEIVIGDCNKLRQIILNLCGNSMKFTTVGYVKVDVSVEELTKEYVKVQIVVQDTGIGIPQDKLSVIFEDFEQVESSLSRKVQGAGLGLAIVARIIQNMNGQLQVESDIDKGTKLSVFLRYPLFLPDGTQEKPVSSNRNVSVSSADSSPKFEERALNVDEGSMEESGPITVIGSTTYVTSPPKQTPSTPIVTSPAAKQPPSQPKLKILYAEDDPVNQSIITKRLAKLGYEVACCENGIECVALFEKDHAAFDIILMDVQMPLCNGLEATKRIRRIENETEVGHLPLSHVMNRYRIPILATSASVYESDVVNCIHAGMDGFINKPIDVKLLDKLLNGAINFELREKYMISETGKRQEGAWFDDRKLRVKISE